jgi:hypothetical protein
MFAYKDVSENQSMLKLFAQVIPTKSGRWEFSKVLLYQDGLKLFGEGRWSLISNHVGTRDRFQAKRVF